MVLQSPVSSWNQGYSSPIGTIVYREPSKEHEGTYTKNLHRVYDFDPEPFEIVNREGIHVGKYEIRSLLTGYKDMR
jgi:hypothetical protein